MYHCNARLDGLRKKLCYESLRGSSWLPVVFAVGLVLATTAQGALAKAAKPEPFKVTNIHFETNSSACDMGIQMAFDTDGVTEGSVEDPKGQVVYAFKSTGGMADIGGQTEGFLEGVEPQIRELLDELGCEPSDEEETIQLEELFAAWPAGKYEFQGKGGGVTFEGEALLSHRIPAGPEITEPDEAAMVSSDLPLLIEWNEVTDPILPNLGPVKIVGYHVVVVETGAEALPQLDVDLPEDQFSVTVPAEYLKPNTIYQFEVLATEESGNQTITEGLFCTEGIAVCELPE
jgi:hypothetical protein